jgi:hypothetical protein
MAEITDEDAIVVDRQSVDSDDPDNDIVQSNIEFVNSLFGQYYMIDEVSQDALRSYEVDYYLSQMLNGGFAQFVKNSNWTPPTVRLVREGLIAVGATGHLELFEEGVALVVSLGETGLKSFFVTKIRDYAKSTERELLAAIDDRFFKLDVYARLTHLDQL